MIQLRDQVTGKPSRTAWEERGLRERERLWICLIEKDETFLPKDEGVEHLGAVMGHWEWKWRELENLEKNPKPNWFFRDAIARISDWDIGRGGDNIPVQALYTCAREWKALHLVRRERFIKVIQLGSIENEKVRESFVVTPKTLNLKRRLSLPLSWRN